MTSPAAAAASEFQEERDEVRATLLRITAELEQPLQQLVRSQVDRAAPHLRAAVVLAFGMPSLDTPAVRSKRIHLAAALELLYVAHRIHALLLTPVAETMNRSLMGSTILAGDYCFSHAASLAARTDDAQIVRLFSEALKRVSEGNLRALFQGADGDFDENESLFLAGITASRLIAERPTLESAAAQYMVRELQQLRSASQTDGDPHLLQHPTLTAEERLRLAQLFNE